MSEMLDKVVAMAAEKSGIPANRLSAVSAVDQDMGISGEDVTNASSSDTLQR